MSLQVESESPFFLVGCTRSGTTILRDLLNSHPRLTIPGESHFIVPFYQAYGDPRDEREAVELARKTLHFWRVRCWELPLTPADFAGYRSFRDMVLRLYETWARLRNRPRWGDKTPYYVLTFPVLRELFPGAKIIHIIRDGRDVALSWLRSKYDPCNLFVAAAKWRERVRRGRQAGAPLLGRSYMEVRYEALLAEPARTLQAVCAFLGEEFHEAMLRPTRGSDSRAESELLASNHGKWKTRMSRRDRILFESVAGDLLEELGYVTEGCRRRISRLEQWMWKTHHFWGRKARWLTIPSQRAQLPGYLALRWACLRARLKA